MDNIEFFGLHKGQIVHVDCEKYKGMARVSGSPPQGTGIYVTAPGGKQYWVSGEDIRESTRMGDGSPRRKSILDRIFRRLMR